VSLRSYRIGERPVVEQPFECLVIQNRQATHSTESAIDWAVKDNIVNGLFCATLTSRGRGHTPFV